MGLLLGDVKPSPTVEGCEEVFVWGMKIMKRSDRKKDRVECSPENLAAAIPFAEKIAKDFDRKTNVVGWYHSHPNITIWPSHIDVRTQFLYQKMSASFVGIIFSVFQNTKDCGDKMRIIAFQSVDCRREPSLEKEIRERHIQSGQPQEYREIPMDILPPKELFRHGSSNPTTCTEQPVLASSVHLYDSLRRLVALTAEEEREMAINNLPNHPIFNCLKNNIESRAWDKKDMPDEKDTDTRKRKRESESDGPPTSSNQYPVELLRNCAIRDKYICLLIECLGLPLQMQTRIHKISEKLEGKEKDSH